MNLNIDDEALASLYADLKQQNYPGTFEDLTLSVERASTASESRKFWSQVGNLQPDHPFRQWFNRLSRHFSDITYYGGYPTLWTGVIILGARKPPQGRPKFVQGVVLDFRATHDLERLRVVASYCQAGEAGTRRVQRITFKPTSDNN